MVKVEIVLSLYEEISKRFKKESVTVLKHLKTLEKSPKKGKVLGVVGGILIKELKYKNYRFYFLVDSFKIKFISIEEISDLLLRFVRMSDKKEQQKTIEEIKEVLRSIGPKGFS